MTVKYSSLQRDHYRLNYLPIHVRVTFINKNYREEYRMLLKICLNFAVVNLLMCKFLFTLQIIFSF